LGEIAGTVAATALGQPELISVLGSIGSATEDQLAKRGRKRSQETKGPR
jgi:hypothetical protein